MKPARPMATHYAQVFTAEEVGKIIQAVVASTLTGNESHKEWLTHSKLLLTLK